MFVKYLEAGGQHASPKIFATYPPDKRHHKCNNIPEDRIVQHFDVTMPMKLRKDAAYIDLPTLHFPKAGGTLLVAQLVEALGYKPEGCWFDSRWCHLNFSLT
jgi:hypothetical protein